MSDQNAQAANNTEPAGNAGTITPEPAQGAGAAATGTTGTPAAPAADEFAGLTPDELTARLKREIADRQAANKEAQKIRAELKRLSDADEERKKAEMSEAERLKADLETERARAQAAEERAVSASIAARATALGIIDPDAAIALINRKSINDAGATPESIDAALNELIAVKPYLKAQPPAQSAGLPRSNPAASTGKTPDAAADAAKREQAQKDFPYLKRIG